MLCDSSTTLSRSCWAITAWISGWPPQTNRPEPFQYPFPSGRRAANLPHHHGARSSGLPDNPPEKKSDKAPPGHYRLREFPAKIRLWTGATASRTEAAAAKAPAIATGSLPPPRPSSTLLRAHHEDVALEAAMRTDETLEKGDMKACAGSADLCNRL